MYGAPVHLYVHGYPMRGGDTGRGSCVQVFDDFNGVYREAQVIENHQEFVMVYGVERF